MPAAISDWLLLALVMLVARIVFFLALINAGPRHARYRMRVKLARWLLSDQLRAIGQVRKGRLLVPNVSVRGSKRRAAAQRPKVLSVVRRDDPRAGSAEA